VRVTAWLAGLTASVLVAVAGGQSAPIDLARLLARTAARLETFYARASRIICIESVRLQPLAPDLMPAGRPRRLVYELRISREERADGGANHAATMLRALRTVNGQPARPGDEPECLDPKTTAPDPLAFLLAGQQHKYAFSFKGTSQADGRAAAMLEYVAAGSPPPEIVWKDDNCVSVSLPARTIGRVWIDVATGDVLRLDERVMGPFDIPVPTATRRAMAPLSLVFDRAESSTRYKAVTFDDPRETVMLPESIESTRVFRNGGMPRLRTVQTFSDYQRFVTDARIVR
jgi:hypothetical protein